MSLSCTVTSPDLGVIRELLTVTRCNVGAFSESGYAALTGPHSIFPVAVTILLTIYVAVLGYRLLLGLGAPALSEIPLIGLKIGTVLALTLNWNIFQTLVLDTSVRAPTELASAIVGPQYAPLERLQAAYDALRADQAAFAKKAHIDANGTGPNPDDLQAASELSYASDALLAATGGLLAFATVVTGVLALVGPIFLTLFLFESAGGLFAGWVRAIAASAIVPMLCWITIIIMLAALGPRLEAIDQQTASSNLDASEAVVTSLIVFVFAAAQFGLVIASVIVAAGFRLPIRRTQTSPAQPSANVRSWAAGPADSRIDQLVHALHRSTNANVSAPAPAYVHAAAPNDNTPPPHRLDPSPRAQRLGEDYRRLNVGRPSPRAERL